MSNGSGQAEESGSQQIVSVVAGGNDIVSDIDYSNDEQNQISTEDESIDKHDVKSPKPLETSLGDESVEVESISEGTVEKPVIGLAEAGSSKTIELPEQSTDGGKSAMKESQGTATSIVDEPMAQEAGVEMTSDEEKTEEGTVTTSIEVVIRELKSPLGKESADEKELVKMDTDDNEEFAREVLPVVEPIVEVEEIEPTDTTDTMGFEEHELLISMENLTNFKQQNFKTDDKFASSSAYIEDVISFAFIQVNLSLIT